jgi:hypothetical protein
MKDTKPLTPRKRSLRNKIVSMLLGVPSVVVAAEQAFPGKIPPGTGALLAQVCVMLGLGANNLIKR